MNPLGYEAALTRASAYCAQAERCASDVKNKLVQWGLEIQEVERAVARLQELGFLDEERYIHAFIHDKFTYAHWGRQKILYTLGGKHVDMALAQRIADELIGREESTDTLVNLLRPKLRGLTFPLSRNDYARLFRFAAGRGFDADSFSRALSRLQIDQNEEDF